MSFDKSDTRLLHIDLSFEYEGYEWAKANPVEFVRLIFESGAKSHDALRDHGVNLLKVDVRQPDPLPKAL